MTTGMVDCKRNIPGRDDQRFKPLALEFSWHSHAQYGRYAIELHHHEYQLSNHVRIGWQRGFVKDVGRLHCMIPVVRIGTMEQKRGYGNCSAVLQPLQLRPDTAIVHHAMPNSASQDRGRKVYIRCRKLNYWVEHRCLDQDKRVSYVADCPPNAIFQMVPTGGRQASRFGVYLGM